jgi:hypothetical protein
LVRKTPAKDISLKLVARATTEPPQNYGSDFEAAANRGWSKGYGAAGASLVKVCIDVKAAVHVGVNVCFNRMSPRWFQDLQVNTPELTFTF